MQSSQSLTNVIEQAIRYDWLGSLHASNSDAYVKAFTGWHEYKDMIEFFVLDASGKYFEATVDAEDTPEIIRLSMLACMKAFGWSNEFLVLALFDEELNEAVFMQDIQDFNDVVVRYEK